MNRPVQIQVLEQIDAAMVGWAHDLTYHGLTHLPAAQQAYYRLMEAQLWVEECLDDLKQEEE